MGRTYLASPFRPCLKLPRWISPCLVGWGGGGVGGGVSEMKTRRKRDEGRWVGGWVGV